jgi:hypothetical protein
MPRIRCHYVDCVFLDDSYCSAAAVEFDPDTGCMTFSPISESSDEDKWDEGDELDEWEDLEAEEEEDDLWSEGDNDDEL